MQTNAAKQLKIVHFLIKFNSVILRWPTFLSLLILFHLKEPTCFIFGVPFLEPFRVFCCWCPSCVNIFNQMNHDDGVIYIVVLILTAWVETKIQIQSESPFFMQFIFILHNSSKWYCWLTVTSWVVLEGSQALFCYKLPFNL